MKGRLFTFFLLFLFFRIYAQEERIDSLLYKLDETEIYDRSYVDLVNDLSFEYLKSDPLKAPYYINLAISVASQISYNEGLIRATTNKGTSYWVNGLLDEALSYYLLSLSHGAEKFPLEYARLNNNIGEVFKKKSLYDSAKKYYRNAFRMVKNRLPDRNPVLLSSNVGETFLMLGEIDSAEFYYRQGLKNALKESNERALAYAYYGLGEIAFHQNYYGKADSLQRMALDLRLKVDDKRGIIQSYIALGTYEIHKRNSGQVFFFWNAAEKLAISIRALDLLNEVYISKSEYYYQTQQYKAAAEYIGAYTELSDSIRSEEFASSLERTKTALLSEISDAENKLLKQQQEQSQKESRLMSLFFVGFGAVLIALSVVIRFYKKRRNTLAEIARESEINDSLISLSKEVNESPKGFDDFISKLLVDSKKVLKTDRASYWYFNKSNKNLECYRLVDAEIVKNSSHIIPKKDSPSFFKELLSNRTFAVSDIKTDPRCEGVDPNKLFEQNISSFIVSPLFLNDEYVGLIGFSMINETRDWSFSDQRYVGSLADIFVSALANNQKKALEAERELLIEKLLTKNKSLKEFNSVISHNLREPLAQIIGFSSLLSNDLNLSDKESNEIISRLGESSDRIDMVIKDLSTLLNEHDPDVEDMKEVDLERVIEEVAEVLSNDIKRINPEINLNLSTSLFTYKPFIFDIIYHLFTNSLKFRDHSRSLVINISSRKDENNFFIDFSDNGRGIDLLSFNDRIFKMYMRQHLDVEGRGVGLYIVKNRIQTLNGTIKVESEVMEGTTFTISLPVKFFN